MKEFFSKKYQKVRSHIENIRSKFVVRFQNNATRLDQSHSHDESKKKGKGK
jgi:hypothetical protein